MFDTLVLIVSKNEPQNSPELDQRREPEEPEEKVGHDQVEHPSSVVLHEVHGRRPYPRHLEGFPLRLGQRCVVHLATAFTRILHPRTKNTRKTKNIGRWERGGGGVVRGKGICSHVACLDFQPVDRLFDDYDTMNDTVIL